MPPAPFPADWVPPAEVLPSHAHYRLKKNGRLGEGGSGVVYAAVDDRLKVVGRRANAPSAVAIKFLLGGEEMATRDALHEAGRYREVRHQNLVPMLDFLDLREHNGWPPFAIVMELFDSSLRDLLALVSKTSKLLSPSTAVRYAGELALALNALHTAHGLVHRDIKPGNLFLKLHPGENNPWDPSSYESAQLLLGDLGVADKAGQKAVFKLGRDPWKPPELPPASEDQFPAFSEDIYAFGKVLFDLADRVDNGASFPNRLRALARLCTMHDPMNRPPADELLTLLSDADVLPSRLIAVAEELKNYRAEPVPEIGQAATDEPDLIKAYASVSKGRVEVSRGILAEAKAAWHWANPDLFVDFPLSEAFAYGSTDHVNWMNAFQTTGGYSGQLLAALLLVQDESGFTQEARLARARMLAHLQVKHLASGS